MTKRLLLLGACLLTAAAAAQDKPPIKAGLWQLTMARDIDGREMPNPTARLDSMPPDARKRIQERLKERGVDAGAGDLRVCVSQEMLDAGNWRREGSQCKTEYSVRNASLWKWHSSCTAPALETDGEARFNSPESYSITLDTKSGARKVHQAVTGTWLGADCGDLKPALPRP